MTLKNEERGDQADQSEVETGKRGLSEHCRRKGEEKTVLRQIHYTKKRVLGLHLSSGQRAYGHLKNKEDRGARQSSNQGTKRKSR